MARKSYLVLLVLSVLAGSATAQTVTDFGVYRMLGGGQSMANVANIPSAPYYPTRFYAEVLGSGLNSFSSLSFDTPAGGIGNRTIPVPPSGLRATTLIIPGDEATRDSQYPLGTYNMNLGATTVSLDIVAGNTPNRPVVQGGTWTDERLQVSDSGYTFNFNTPTDTTNVRLYIYQQSGAYDSYTFSASGTATSIFVSGSSLELGVNYGAALDFFNVVDTTTAFDGAVGAAGFMARTEFQFAVVASAVPEPSTYAVIFGGVALGLAGVRRRGRSRVA